MSYFENFMKANQPLKSQCCLYNVAVRIIGRELVHGIFGGLKKRPTAHCVGNRHDTIKLEYPVKITRPNAAAAKVIISQLGGPDGEMGAATRYLSQRYAAPWGQVKAGLTDIGTEELAHIEIVSAILHQLTKGLSVDEIKEGGFETYFVDHTTGIYPQAASGIGPCGPFR